jgi:hypothetical protein
MAKTKYSVVPMPSKQMVAWIFPGTKQAPEAKTYETKVEPGACPFCLKVAVVALPEPLLAVQPDETTHVCAPFLGGCNYGFSKS